MSDKHFILSIRFSSLEAMMEWVRDTQATGAFGTIQNKLVPSVRDPIPNVGVRPFDALDQAPKSHFILTTNS
jgi:hypothetical protein